MLKIPEHSIKEESQPTNRFVEILTQSNKIDLSKVNVKPQFIVERDDNTLLYLYKLKNDECWYEYTEPKKDFRHDIEREQLLDTITSEKVVEFKSVAEEKLFMQTYLECILDPPMYIKSYLDQRWYCKLFLVLNFVIELLLLALYFIINQGV